MENNIILNRRTLMAGSAAAMVPAMHLASGGAAMAASETAAAPAASGPDINRLKLGAFRISVIRDGFFAAGKPSETFGLGQPQADIDALLTQNFLPTDALVNGFSPVVVDTGSEVILFDTGLGENGRGKGGGRLLDGLKAAGYTPDQISIVVITHMHGDHIGGLMEKGQPAFPKARYVTGQTEYDFWTDKARQGTPAENGHKLVMSNVEPLAQNMTFINDGADVVSGVTSMLAAGHSPGHMIYKLESEGKQLILTADTANHYVLSLQRPDWEVRFDMDKPMAAATRKKVFDMISTDRIAFLGYHMPFPSVGFLEKQDTGYRFVPKAYQFDI